MSEYTTGEDPALIEINGYNRGLTDGRLESIREIETLREALQCLHDDNIDYCKINCLSGAINNHSMKRARKALRLPIIMELQVP